MFREAVQALAPIASVDTINIQAQQNIGEAGALSLGKLASFAKLLITQVLPLVRRPPYDILYYCPAGPNLIGVIKDIVLLSAIRPRVRRTVYHFHATGSGAFIAAQAKWLRALALKFVFAPDLAIRCADVEPNDATAYGALRDRIIANGIEDPFSAYEGLRRTVNGPATLTYVGAMIEEKGIFDLLEAAAHLKGRGTEFVLNYMGEGTSADLARFDREVEARDLSHQVRRLGVLSGKQKYDVLFATDVFVFPSFFRSETQPLAVIEAHAMGIPAVAYDWRGLSTIVEDGVTGRLVPTRQVAQFADAIRQIVNDGSARMMGVKARRRFEERFTLERFNHEIRDAIVEVAGRDRSGA